MRNILKKIEIDRSTISKILKKSEFILSDTSTQVNATHIYPTKYPILDEALMMWMQSARLQNIAISDEHLLEQAKTLSVDCGVY